MFRLFSIMALAASMSGCGQSDLLIAAQANHSLLIECYSGATRVYAGRVVSLSVSATGNYVFEDQVSGERVLINGAACVIRFYLAANKASN